MPIDWLMNYWHEIKSQDRRVEKLTPPASLFQHIGDISSLQEKGLSGREQREPFFNQFDQKFKGMNPSATVTTSMSFSQRRTTRCLWKRKWFFLSFNSSKGGLSVDEVSNTNCSPTSDGGNRVSLWTARFSDRRYPSRKPTWRGKYTFKKSSDLCGTFTTLGPLNKGRIDIFPNNSKKFVCLRILETDSHANFVYFREINIW